jgi:hypothetical protein
VKEQFDMFNALPPLGPFAAMVHPRTAHTAAAQTVAREGVTGIRKGSHRHKVLVVFSLSAKCGEAGLSQIEAGKRALALGVGEGTQSGWEVGRRRCSDLVKLGVLEEVPDRVSGLWRISDLGLRTLRELDA